MPRLSALEARILNRLREFSGPSSTDEQGVQIPDLCHDGYGDTYTRVSGALHRLARKGLAVAARVPADTYDSGPRGGSWWLWYPVREEKP